MKINKRKKEYLKLKRIRNFELKFGLDKRGRLPKEFIERVKGYKNKIKEVETTTLKETLDSFERDLFPSRELEVWESIAEYYNDKLRKKPHMDISQKRDLFTEALVWILG